jgi:hypothetical protein
MQGSTQQRQFPIISLVSFLIQRNLSLLGITYSELNVTYFLNGAFITGHEVYVEEGGGGG